MGIPLSSVANSRPTRPLIPFFNNRIFQKGCAKMLKAYISLILLAAIAISLTSSSIVKRQSEFKPIEPIAPIRTRTIAQSRPTCSASTCRQCKTDFGRTGILNFNCDQGCGLCPLCNLFPGANPNCKHCKNGKNNRQKINNCKSRCKEGKKICDDCGC